MKKRCANILAISLLLGCTVAPPLVKDLQPSFDGGVQNSGFIGFTVDGSGIITPHARDRYNGLVQIYGTNFVPVLRVDAGITATPSNAFVIDAQHLVDFATMNRWRKNAR